MSFLQQINATKPILPKVTLKAHDSKSKQGFHVGSIHLIITPSIMLKKKKSQRTCHEANEGIVLPASASKVKPSAWFYGILKNTAFLSNDNTDIQPGCITQ